MKTQVRSLPSEKITPWLRRFRMSLSAWFRRWSWRTPFGIVRLGVFGNPNPVSASFGFDRGTPIDRWYIERFLGRNGRDIAGRVLEIGDRIYSKKFNGDKVKISDVLHVEPGNEIATHVGNLETGEGIPVGVYDCLILTQTIHCIFDLSAVMRNVRRALLPGGVALITVPCLSPISQFDASRWGDYWRLTPQALARVAESAFQAEEIRMDLFGNRTTGAALLFGLVAEDLPKGILEETDPSCPMILGIRLQKTI